MIKSITPVAPGVNVLTEPGNVYRAPGVNQHVFSAITANPSKEKIIILQYMWVVLVNLRVAMGDIQWYFRCVAGVLRGCLLIQVKQSQPKATGILDSKYVSGLFFNANVWNLESSVLLSVNLITYRSNNTTLQFKRSLMLLTNMSYMARVSYVWAIVHCQTQIAAKRKIFKEQISTVASKTPQTTACRPALQS